MGIENVSDRQQQILGPSATDNTALLKKQADLPGNYGVYGSVVSHLPNSKTSANLSAKNSTSIIYGLQQNTTGVSTYTPVKWTAADSTASIFSRLGNHSDPEAVANFLKNEDNYATAEWELNRAYDFIEICRVYKDDPAYLHRLTKALGQVY
ncbi:MAG: hypothetical protein JW841_02935 [Deltaproteobacteria bacterium]|nr:hypothetical protein [Deltaproteobacteria bacterium]